MSALAARVRFRDATREELAAILGLLDEDAISRARSGHSTAVTAAVIAAFERIDADPANALWVGTLDAQIVATLQLTLIPGLVRDGLTRVVVEAVRVRADLRGQGVGEAMMQAAMDWARARGARQMQLTTDKRRGDAHRFYVRLGFEATHEGMKRIL